MKYKVKKYIKEFYVPFTNVIMADILIVDDEADIRKLVSEILVEDAGYSSVCVGTVSAALEQLAIGAPKVILLDIWLEGSNMDGIGLLKIIKKKLPLVPVVMISGHGNIDTAVQTIKLGAYDYIEKPFKAAKLLIMVKRAMEVAKLVQENIALRQQEYNLELIGQSKAISHIREIIKVAAPTNSRVLITGELGSGKATAARIIHNLSKRFTSRFIFWSTSSKHEEQLTKEFFVDSQGHGPLIEQAYTGTLFIDELTSLPLSLQAQLLEFLETGYILKPHYSGYANVGVRVIAASSTNLQEAIKLKKLNESLYYRLNIVQLQMPSLRERKQDIISLTEHFMHILSRELGIDTCIITSDAYNIMLSYNWPGNVRQLRNAVEWMLIIAASQKKREITKEMLPKDVIDDVTAQHNSINPVSTEIMSKPLKEARELFEKYYIAAQIAKFDGNIAKTAGFIGMDRTALHRKVKLLHQTLQNSTILDNGGLPQ